MTNKRRILKTGALAIVVTIAFASFVFRVEEWTKALRSDFVVYGQVMTPPAGGGTGGGGGTTPPTTVTKILPQIAVGSFDGNLTKYATVIQIVNTNSNSVTVKGNFYKQIDGNLSDLTYTTNRGVSVTAGVLNETILPGNSSLVITGSLPTTTQATYKGNWAKIQATGSVTIASFFEIRDVATNVLYSRVGISASPVMSKFAIPRVRNVAAGLDVGYAIANMGPSTATITATLRDAIGVQIGSPKTISLDPGIQKADFIGSLFGLSETGATTTYSYVTFDGGSSAQLGAIAVSFEGASQTSFPVDQLQ